LRTRRAVLPHTRQGPASSVCLLVYLVVPQKIQESSLALKSSAQSGGELQPGHVLRNLQPDHLFERKRKGEAVQHAHERRLLRRTVTPLHTDVLAVIIPRAVQRCGVRIGRREARTPGAVFPAAFLVRSLTAAALAARPLSSLWTPEGWRTERGSVSD